ncbi:MAG: ABC transporter permease, partial [Lutisporaceae bacterium]
MIVLKMALRNVKTNLKKQIIICIVFFLATSALTVNVIGAEAIKSSMQNACKKIFTGDIMIKNENYEFALGKASSDELNVVSNVSQLRQKLLEDKDVLGILTRIRKGVEVKCISGSAYMNLLGVDTTEEIRFSDLDVKEGRNIENTNEALMGETYMNRLNLSMGDKIVVNTMNVNADVTEMEFEIVGVLDDENMNFMRQDSLIINLQDGEQLIGIDDVATEVLIYLKSGVDSSSALSRLNNIAKDYDGLAFLWDDVGSEVIYASFGAYISILLLGVACVVIICALVFNLSLMSIHRRLREIGTMLALGVKHRTVLGIICLENLIIGLSASLAGMLFTLLGVKLLLKDGIP